MSDGEGMSNGRARGHTPFKDARETLRSGGHQGAPLDAGRLGVGT